MRLRAFPGEGGALEMSTADEQLILDLAAGREEAIGPLYARYAPIVFGMAARAVDRATAEELVQDVFLAVWRNAASFDSTRGPLRPWLLQIAHYRIANELRRRSRRPRTESDPEGATVANLPDPSPGQAEETWKAHRREILKRALEELPAPQRQALGLAYFEELSHGQIAAVLGVPLGTAKSRIRAGLAGLRGKLATLVAALLLAALLGGLAIRYRSQRLDLARNERALSMLTSSDAQSLRLAPLPGTPVATHATYRFRTGGAVAVVTLSNFPAAGPGEVYRVWAAFGGRWTRVGDASPDATGRARILAEGDVFSAKPETIEVTRESGAAGTAPRGPVLVRWPSDHD
jgi:RNA polymerase sigma factor (sigma-70 family)